MSPKLLAPDMLAQRPGEPDDVLAHRVDLLVTEVRLS
jgi:hypothetical protein